MQQNQDLAERRVAARIDVERPVTVVVDGEERAARTLNVSTSGMLVRIEGELTIWSDVTVRIPALGERPARIVRRDGARYGLVLREALDAAEFAAFTGHAIAADAPVDTGPAPRVSPWAFGRDRMKGFRRRAAEGMPGSR